MSSTRAVKMLAAANILAFLLAWQPGIASAKVQEDPYFCDATQLWCRCIEPTPWMPGGCLTMDLPIASNCNPANPC